MKGLKAPAVSHVLAASRVEKKTTAGDIAGRLLREAGVALVPGEAFGTAEHLRVPGGQILR